MSTSPRGSRSPWIGRALLGLVLLFAATAYVTCFRLNNDGGADPPTAHAPGQSPREPSARNRRTRSRPSEPRGDVSSPTRGELAAPPANEDSLMAGLRQAVDADPKAALELASRGEARYPNGRHADERAWLKMRALVHVAKIARARDEALIFFQRFPRSSYRERVYRLTGVRPRPRPGPR